MRNSWSKKLKYFYIAFNEKLAVWNEKQAHKHFTKAEAEILRFKDMACFGCSNTGPWECGFFHKDFVCQHETCPLQKLNQTYVIASYSWERARLALNQSNSIVNAIREDMDIKKVR